MTTSTYKLVTIICEPVLSMPLTDLARKLGAKGFTVTEVRGEGSGTKRTGEIPDEKVKIEIIGDSALSKKLMDEVASAYFKDYSVITYATDITVMRPGKF